MTMEAHFTPLSPAIFRNWIIGSGRLDRWIIRAKIAVQNRKSVKWMEKRSQMRRCCRSAGHALKISSSTSAQTIACVWDNSPSSSHSADSIGSNRMVFSFHFIFLPSPKASFFRCGFKRLYFNYFSELNVIEQLLFDSIVSRMYFFFFKSKNMRHFGLFGISKCYSC